MNIPLKLFPLLLACAFAKASQTCPNSKHKPLAIYGTYQVDHCKLKHAHISGLFDAKDSTLSFIQVFGHVRLRQAKVTNALRIYGALDGKTSEFKGPISLHGNHILLKNCHTKNIRMISNKQHPGKIILRHSQINGTITIKPEHGIINMDAASHITGKIIGAKIVTQPASTAAKNHPKQPKTHNPHKED
jgi:hypothetical protein